MTSPASFRGNCPEEPALGDSRHTGLEIAKDLVSLITQGLGVEIANVEAQIRRFKEIMADLHPDANGEDARRRLQNPRLRTTYLDDRMQALTVKSIEIREQLVRSLPALVEAAIKLELIEAELDAAKALRAEQRSAVSEREATGLFPAVARQAEYLWSRYRVKHWHWAAADQDQLKRIAEILLERSAR
jgi:hypothetical protein